MKNINEHYKDWCGEHHTTNSCHPVHDSAECCDFAEYYHKEMMKKNNTQMKNCEDCDYGSLDSFIEPCVSCDTKCSNYKNTTI